MKHGKKYNESAKLIDKAALPRYAEFRRKIAAYPRYHLELHGAHLRT